MPRIVIEQPGEPVRSVPLSGNETRLGRAEDNDVVLVAVEVSRHHATLEQHGEKIILKDLESMNGTYVNRQRIVERVLSHMDEIWFGGKSRIVFRDDSEDQSGDAERGARSSAPGLADNLEKIREEMDRVSVIMTMMGKAGESGSTTQGAAMDAAAPKGEDVLNMGKAFRRLTALYNATRQISSGFDLNKRLADVMDTAVEVMGANRGFLLLNAEGRSELDVRVARGMGGELQASSPSMGIARSAAIDGEPVLMLSAESDSQFGMRESIIRQKIGSAMCVPLRVEDRILGSIYVDKQRNLPPFNEEDLELFASIAAQSAMAIHNVQLYEQMMAAEKERTRLGRFLSPTIVGEIMKESSRLELGGRKTQVTTMFADVRGFTKIGEMLSPGELVGLLNEHFTAMTEIVFKYSGALDKYNGDEVMALFGAPLAADDDAERALRAALEMQQRNAELNAERARTSRPTFELGIGVATGEVIAGYIGSPDRMDFTVMGDRVNTASRFCSAAAAGQILTGETTRDMLDGIFEFRAAGTPLLKNKAEVLETFEVVSLKPGK